MSRRMSRTAAAVATAAISCVSDESDVEVVNDTDGLEVVGKSGAKKRRHSSSAAPSASSSANKKSRRSLLLDDEVGSDGDAEDEGLSSSTLVTSIAKKAASLSTDPSSMSRVARAEHATHLNYFDQLSQPTRSKNTLKDVAKLTAEQRARIAASLPLRHPAEKARLFAYHQSQMREWYLQLRAGGYNLLAYGFGSKKKLLSEFARTWLTDGPVVVLNGYHQFANVKNLLNTLTRDLMNHPTQTFRDLHAHVEFIREWFRNDTRMTTGRRGRTTKSQEEVDECDSDMEENQAIAAAKSSSSSSSSAFLPRVYILIHNIDGVPLRGEAQQHILALLASIPQIHLVASVDHILSGWLWDQSLLNHFNFIHHDCTTYADYSEFASSEGSGTNGPSIEGGGLVDTSLSGRAAGITHVLTSLTANHRKILDVLAREQLTPNNPHFLAGTTFVTRKAFLHLCEENMLVNSAAGFDRLLGELKDHKLVDEKSIQRQLVVIIPHSSLIIRRHILGEKDDDPAVLAAAAAAEEDARREAARVEENPFARAVGADQAGDEAEGEDDGIEVDDDDEEE